MLVTWGMHFYARGCDVAVSIFGGIHVHVDIIGCPHDVHMDILPLGAQVEKIELLSH